MSPAILYLAVLESVCMMMRKEIKKGRRSDLPQVTESLQMVERY